MRKLAILLSFLCLPLFSKTTDSEFVKQQIENKFGTKWKQQKIYRFSLGSKSRLFNTISKKTNTFILVYVASNEYKNGKSIIAVLERFVDKTARADDTDLFIFEWFIDKKTNQITHSYQNKLFSVGQFGQCNCFFNYEKITDTNSIIIVEDKQTGQGINVSSTYILFQNTTPQVVENTKMSSVDFELPESSWEEIDTMLILSSYKINTKKSEILFNFEDYTEWNEVGSKYYEKKYYLRNNKLFTIED